MNINDLALVSVDDHVVDPPSVFEERWPRRSTGRWHLRYRRVAAQKCSLPTVELLNSSVSVRQSAVDPAAHR